MLERLSASGVDTEHLAEPFADGPLPEMLTACR